MQMTEALRIGPQTLYLVINIGAQATPFGALAQVVNRDALA